MEIAPLCLYLVDWASSLGFTLPSDSGEKLSLGEHLTFSFLFYRKGHNPSWFVTLPNTKSLLVSKCKIYVICPEIVRQSSKEPLSMWVGLKLWINRKKGSILTSLNRIQKINKENNVKISSSERESCYLFKGWQSCCLWPCFSTW